MPEVESPDFVKYPDYSHLFGCFWRNESGEEYFIRKKGNWWLLWHKYSNGKCSKPLSFYGKYEDGGFTAGEVEKLVIPIIMNRERKLKMDMSDVK